jgi:oligosaccharide reducing-end xylanase
MNVSLDYLWFKADKWEVEQSNRLLKFFYDQGMLMYGDRYKITGEKTGNDHSLGLVAMNAVACLAATTKERKEFVDELWNASLPSGTWRYYSSMLYMIALLNVSGNYKIYAPK